MKPGGDRMRRILAAAAALAVIVGHGAARPAPQISTRPEVIISIRLDSGECILGPLVQDGPGNWVPME